MSLSAIFSVVSSCNYLNSTTKWKTRRFTLETSVRCIEKHLMNTLTHCQWREAKIPLNIKASFDAVVAFSPKAAHKWGMTTYHEIRNEIIYSLFITMSRVCGVVTHINKINTYLKVLMITNIYVGRSRWGHMEKKNRCQIIWQWLEHYSAYSAKKQDNWNRFKAVDC